MSTNVHAARAHSHDHNHDNPHDHDHLAATVAATNKHASTLVSPFLRSHIPQQYHPPQPPPSPPPTSERSQPQWRDKERPVADTTANDTRYCYRHRPDLKCRRQADEPSMEQLQKELNDLPTSDQQGIAHVWSLFSAAPSKHRNLILQGILAQCCFPQLSLISASVRDLIKIDFLSALPSELGFKILCHLDTSSLCKAAQVSRRWRALADDDVVWHRMCEQHIDRKCTKCGWGLPLLDRKRLRTEKRRIQLRATSQGKNEWSPKLTPLPDDPPQSGEDAANGIEGSSDEHLEYTNERKRSADTSPSLETTIKKQCSTSVAQEDDYFRPRRSWKDVYRDRFRIGTNWKYGRCSTKLFLGHTNGVTCLQFDDNVLATGSYDSTIKIWDIHTGKEIRTLHGHTRGIRCLQLIDKRIISGGLDSTIRVWNWETGECVRTLTPHTDGIISLHHDGEYLASGSIDGTIRVYKSNDNSTFLLRGHTDWVNSVKIDTASRTLFSGSDDCTVRLWDLDSRRCLYTFEGHVGQVQQVVLLPREFELEEDAPGADDINSPTSEGERSPPSSAEQHHVPHHRHNSTHRSSSHDHTDELTSFLDATAPNNRPAVPRYMLTGALDSTIRLWDVSTGRCLRTFFGHVEGIWGLAADTLRVVSGGHDRMLKLWDPRSGKCERTFTGHAGPVTCVGLSDGRLCSGSDDGEVRMYSFYNA